MMSVIDNSTFNIQPLIRRSSYINGYI